MTKRNIRAAVAVTLAASLVAGTAYAQFGGGGARWQTDSADAERSGSIAADASLSAANLQSGKIQMIWKQAVPGAVRQLDGVTQPNYSSPRAVMYDGFKYWAYFGGANGLVTQSDFQVGFSGKSRQLGAATGAGTATCPGSIVTVTQPVAPPANLTAAAAAAPAGAAGAAGGGRGGAAGGGRGGAPAAGAAGGRGGAPAAPAGPPPLPARVTDLQATMRPVPTVPQTAPLNTEFYGSVGSAIWAVNDAGKAYALNNQSLEDVLPAVQFVPAGAHVTGLLAINAPSGGGGGRGGGGGGGGGGFAGPAAAPGAPPAPPPPPPPPPNPLDRSLLATTSGACGGAPNGLWKLTIGAGGARPVTSWNAQGANIAGATGLALASLGELSYAAEIATSDGTGPYVNSVVGVDPAAMTVKGQFKASAPFTSSPLTFQMEGKSLVAAMNKDGKLYLLDAANMATPVASTAVFTAGQGDFTTGAMASWADASGGRWIAVPTAGPVSGLTAGNGAVTNGALVAFKVVAQGSGFALQPGWVSRDLTSPSAPAVEGGVIFVNSTGLSTAPAAAAAKIRASKPAVLYALDAATGKELWNSGAAMTAPGARVGPSITQDAVLVSSLDGTLYAYGVPTIQN